MATGNTLKDNGKTIGSGRVFDDGVRTLTMNNFYVATSGKATWLTKVYVYGAPGGAFNGASVRIAVYGSGSNDLGASHSKTANRLYEATISTVDGWNEHVLPTPIALPVYSGSGAIQKFGIGITLLSSSAYIAADNTSSGVSTSIQSSTVSGLWFSEPSSGGSATPSDRGSFLYDPDGASTSGGVFNFWNGADVEVTDVNPGGGTTAVTKTVAASWKVRAAVAKTSVTTWKVRARITAKTVAASWKVRQAIAKTAAASWRVRQALAKTVPASWNVLGALSSVTKTLATSWRVSAALTKAVASSWKVRAALSKSVASSWRVRAALSKTVAASWKVRGAIAKAIAASWSVRTTVGKAVAASWNVLSNAGFVVKTMTTTWKVRQRIVDATPASWAVRQAITSAAPVSWSVRTALVKSVNAAWSVRNVLLRTVQTSWNVLSNLVFRDITLDVKPLPSRWIITPLTHENVEELVSTNIFTDPRLTKLGSVISSNGTTAIVDGGYLWTRTATGAARLIVSASAPQADTTYLFRMTITASRTQSDLKLYYRPSAAATSGQVLMDTINLVAGEPLDVAYIVTTSSVAPNATTSGFGIITNVAAAGETYTLTNVHVEPTTEIKPYINGSMPDTDYVRYEWVGAVDGSFSTRTVISRDLDLSIQALPDRFHIEQED